MAITHGVAARNAATDAVVDLIDAQTGAGKAVFRIAGSTVAAPSTAVATITLNDPAFGASSGGTATLDAVLELAQEGIGRDEGGYRREFIELVRKARELKPQSTQP